MCTCLLCRKNKANKKGSHIIPNFLIESSFSDGNKKGRGHELVFALNAVCSFSFGRDLSPEKIEKAIGRSLKDEEIERNTQTPIPYIRDYVFCEECEKRLSAIENIYSTAIQKFNGSDGVQELSIAPELSHLFWLSVIWRISAINFEFRFRPETGVEEDMRQILDTCFDKNPADIVVPSEIKQRLQRYVYYLVVFPNNQGISGGYFPPFVDIIHDYVPFFINNYVLMFTPNACNIDVDKEFCYGLQPFFNKETLNNAISVEKSIHLDKSYFERTLKIQVDFHVHRFEDELCKCINDYAGIQCPKDFLHEVFLRYIRPIAEQHGLLEPGALLTKYLSKERLYQICCEVANKWKSNDGFPQELSSVFPL